MKTNFIVLLTIFLVLSLISTACAVPPLDDQLTELIVRAGVVFPQELPAFDPNLVALGEALFWDPILSGNRDMACATCHHPQFGTGDGIPLSVGTGSAGLGPQRALGEGREFVPRNATDIFNRGLPEWTSMFWDSRVQSIEDINFSTPAAYRLPQGLDSVLAAQAMFPVLSRDEMRGDRGDVDIFGQPNELASINDKFVTEIWDAIMLRLLGIPEYRDLFSAAFAVVPKDELGFQHAANAIAAYEAQAFTYLDSPWDRFLAGEQHALSEDAKGGALLFYGEAGCSTCHSGFLMTDQQHYNIGVPQFGPGKGVGDPIDPGLLLESGEVNHRFSFRTPPLRNITLTGPYMHNGAYADLASVIWHHLDPVAALQDYQGSHLPEALRDSLQKDQESLDSILKWLSPEVSAGVELSVEQVEDLLVFLDALTSPTASDLNHLIPDAVPSGLQVGGSLTPGD